LFFLSAVPVLRLLSSFPTRRSSDLPHHTQLLPVSSAARDSRTLPSRPNPGAATPQGVDGYSPSGAHHRHGDRHAAGFRPGLASADVGTATSVDHPDLVIVE